MTEDHSASVKWAVQILKEWGATQAEVGRILLVGVRHERGESDLGSGAPDECSVEARANLIISMDRNLRVLLPQSHAEWARLKNEAPWFRGATPMSILAAGQISDMRKMERWLAGWANN